MKIALILPLLGLNIFALAGCVSQPMPPISTPAQANLRWQAMASDDLDAIHTLIQDAHPGWLDESNPAFRLWAEDGYIQAKSFIPKVSSYDTALSAVRYYVSGFKDGHFTYSDDLGLRSPTESLTGWMVQEVSGNFVVTAVLPNWSAPLPPVGAQLRSCDGHSPSELIAIHVAPYVDRRDSPEVHAGLADGLSGVLMAGEQLKRCTFRIASSQDVDLPTIYQDVTPKAARDFQRQGLSNPIYQDSARRQNTATFRDGTLWIRVQNFMLNEESAVALNVLLSKIASYQGVQRIIFDTRNNGGGDSDVGKRIYESATGGLVFDQTGLDRAPRLYAQWRVSNQAIEKLHRYVEQASKLYGPNSTQMHDAKELEQRLMAAKIAGKIWVDQDEGYSLKKLDMQRNNAKYRNFKGKVALITDRNCASSCLDFADLVLLMPGTKHLGETTSSDTNYIDVTFVATPSGNSVFFPVKVWRNRSRGDSEPLVPDITLKGDMNNEESIYQATIKALKTE